MPSAIRLLDFRPVRIRPFEPRSLRMDLPRTRSVRVAFQAWRARLRSLDLPSIMRPLVRPLRAVHPRPMAAGVVAILGGTFAVLAVARMPAPAIPDQPPTVATRADASANASCARQTWPYLDRRCLADAREATPPVPLDWIRVRRSRRILRQEACDNSSVLARRADVAHLLAAERDLRVLSGMNESRPAGLARRERAFSSSCT